MSESLTAALAAIDEATKNDPEAGTMAAMARGLMRGYDLKWADSKWATVAAEQEFHLPIINPDTGRSSRTFTHAGKFDVKAEFESKRWMVEHKTCAEDIQDPNAPYWRRLEIDAQVSGYVLAIWQQGEKLEGTLYDVIRKPGIRPKQIVAAMRKGIINAGTYYGFPVSDPTRFAVASTMIDENAELFELRLYAEVSGDPDRYFARRAIHRMDSQVLEHARELWQTTDEIRLARAENRHYRNSGACMQWGRPCDFLGICSGHDTPESDRWKKRDGVHSELTTIGDGKDVLTHSRMSTFKTCKAKHFYKYELGIERNDKKEEESLFFGSLLHKALEAWWLALVPAPITV